MFTVSHFTCSVLCRVIFFTIITFYQPINCEYTVLVGKPEGKRPLERPRRRWEDNIKMDLQEVEGGCWDWMELSLDRERWRALVSTVMNHWVP